MTAIVGDVAMHFGCSVGLKDTVTAISIVALGTSLPGISILSKPMNLKLFGNTIYGKLRGTITGISLLRPLNRHVCIEGGRPARPLCRQCNRERERLKCGQRLLGPGHCVARGRRCASISRAAVQSEIRHTGLLRHPIHHTGRLLHCMASVATPEISCWR